MAPTSLLLAYVKIRYTLSCVISNKLAGTHGSFSLNPRLFILLQTLLRSQKIQPLCNQANPHSSAKTRGWVSLLTASNRSPSICLSFVFTNLQIPFSATPFFSHPCKNPRGCQPHPLARCPGVSKMPAMNSQSILHQFSVCFAASAVLFPASWTPLFAQDPPQPRPAIIVSGTIRDLAGTPIPDATVFFEEKATSLAIDAKTAPDGTFSFLSLRAGTYVVRARKEGLREAVSGPMELSLGQKKQLDLVLAPKPAHTKKQSKVNSP